jgi:ABC-type glycerol-3-phosphate transport system permease component
VVPAVVTVALFAFVTSWNEFLGTIESNMAAVGKP